ncbi:hypothetical protein L484_027779 [Morus notabilis]|uniref:BURP domain-containing protein n=1 Tax=Morus notabilis TaxID=981085 RepID=W9RNB6_9ROSA|nr:hypothetical protein L484_027779 [Morus notabilis]
MQLKLRRVNKGFSTYGTGSTKGTGDFKKYTDSANVPELHFTSYSARSGGRKQNFKSYSGRSILLTPKPRIQRTSESFSFGEDNFTSFGKGATGQSIGFKVYIDLNQFKEYTKDKKGVTFATYNITHKKSAAATTTSMAASGSFVKRIVEPGKFFRESMLNTGSVMPMPDIRDKMAKRSFLPRAISSKLPFSSSKMAELKKIFHAGDGSATENMIVDT